MAKTLKKQFPTYNEYPVFLKEAGQTKQFKDYKYSLKQYPFLKNMVDVLPSAAYILNFETQQYPFVSQSIHSIIGYTAKEMIEKGRAFIISRVHPDDLKIHAGAPFKRFIEFILQLPASEIKNFRFSINYRFKRKDGVYVKLLRQCTVFEVNDKGYPLLSLGLLTDITAHKDDNKIMLTVTKYGNGSDVKVLYSDSLPHQAPTLSKRELEVMKFVLQGLSSKKIAEKLYVSTYTIIAHRRNILEKTNCHNLTELNSFAMLNGLG